MSKTKNLVMEKYDDGTVAVLDCLGTVRIINGTLYEEGQVIWLDTEAIDIAKASMDEESTERAIAGDFGPRVIRFPERMKRTLVRRAFPVAASFALAFIFGVGGSVYASGEVAETVEMDGVTYDLNYFNKVISVRVPDADEEMLRELKKDVRGKKVEEAKDIVEEKMPQPVEIAPKHENEKEEAIPEEAMPEEPSTGSESEPEYDDMDEVMDIPDEAMDEPENAVPKEMHPDEPENAIPKEMHPDEEVPKETSPNEQPFEGSKEQKKRPDNTAPGDNRRQDVQPVPEENDGAQNDRPAPPDAKGGQGMEQEGGGGNEAPPSDAGSMPINN